MNHTKNILTYLAFSWFGAALLLVLLLFTPATPQIPGVDTVVVVIAFDICSLLGISLTLKPHWMRKHHHTSTPQNEIQTSQVRSFQGHHPDCPVFSSHTIHILGTTRCAGCIGITLGLLLGMGLATLEIITVPWFAPPLLWLSVGFLLIVLVFGEILMNRRHPAIHVITNSLLGPSFAAIVFITLQHTGQAVFGLFALLLCLLWMDTRVQLSRWRHHQLCAMCDEPCKSFT